MTCGCLIFMVVGIFDLNTLRLLHRGFGPVVRIYNVRSIREFYVSV
jgi:hypothetical protein